jgi:hypothetical protein
VLAEDEEVIIKMRLMRREIPHGQARRKRKNLNGTKRAVFAWDELVVFSHDY